MEYGENICIGCDHFCLNNADGLTTGCRAYPGGIPTMSIGYKHSHDEVYDDQVGDYIYMPAKSKENIMGKKISIFQKD